MDNQFFCYVSVDGDGIGAAVGRASLADDVAEIRRLSNAIDAGNSIWKSWALANGGEAIGCGGDECRLRVPASKLGDIPALRLEYESAVGATCTVGVGRRVMEADKALLAGKLLGKDRVVTYSPDVEKITEEAKHPESEKEKLAHEYLGKAEKPQNNHREIFKQLADEDSRKQLKAQQGATQENEAEELKGLKGQAAEIIIDFQKRLPELEKLKQEDPELYQSLNGTMQTLLAMASKLFGEPEQVMSKAEDYRGIHRAPMNNGENAPLHALHQIYPSDIYSPSAAHIYGHGGNAKEIDQGSVKILTALKDKPEHPVTVYRAVPKALANSKISAGDWVTPNKDYAKLHGEGPLRGDYAIIEHTAPAKHFFSDANSIHEFGYDPGPIKKSEHEDKIPGGEADDMDPVEFDPEQLKIGTTHEMEHTKDHDIAEEIAMDHLAEDPEYYTKLETIEKAGISMGKKLVLPVGTQLDAGANGTHKVSRIKVKNPETGKISWRQVKSGMIMDGQGNPVSSRSQQ